MELPSFTYIENFLNYLSEFILKVIDVLKNYTISEQFKFSSKDDEEEE